MTDHHIQSCKGRLFRPEQGFHRCQAINRATASVSPVGLSSVEGRAIRPSRADCRGLPSRPAGRDIESSQLASSAAIGREGWSVSPAVCRSSARGRTRQPAQTPGAVPPPRLHTAMVSSIRLRHGSPLDSRPFPSQADQLQMSLDDVN